MALRKKKNQSELNQANNEQLPEIMQALRSIRPQSKMGQRLIELSLEGLKEGVEPMSADEILEYLGRNKTYENVH